MAEFWEEAFMDKKEMWGFEPARSAMLTKDFFVEKGLRNILIPGIGYGRNAQIFRENGMSVTGIEISKTAIELARKNYGADMTIFHGSVSEMPFEDKQYDGIFCYALIHLLDSKERAKLISNCYSQLAENGYMVFAVVTKKAPIYGQGKLVSKDRFEIFGGVKMFFYDRESVLEEFGQTGLVEITEVDDVYPFFLIKCRKEPGNSIGTKFNISAKQ